MHVEEKAKLVERITGKQMRIVDIREGREKLEKGEIEEESKTEEKVMC